MIIFTTDTLQFRESLQLQVVDEVAVFKRFGAALVW